MKKLLITAEHLTNAIPEAYRELFLPHEAQLETHLGWDMGTAAIYQYLVEQIPCTAFKARYSRLLIELNRHIKNPRLFSEITRVLPEIEKQKIIKQYYLPYWNQIRAFIHHETAKGYQIIHFSIHSFTPILHGKVRDADIGFLYDPARASEMAIARQGKKFINARASTLRVRMNYPYKGISDGLTTELRKIFNETQYAGIELEMNQKHFMSGSQIINPPLIAAMMSEIFRIA